MKFEKLSHQPDAQQSGLSPEALQVLGGLAQTPAEHAKLIPSSDLWEAASDDFDQRIEDMAMGLRSLGYDNYAEQVAEKIRPHMTSEMAIYLGVDEDLGAEIALSPPEMFGELCDAYSQAHLANKGVAYDRVHKYVDKSQDWAAGFTNSLAYKGRRVFDSTDYRSFIAFRDEEEAQHPWLRLRLLTPRDYIVNSAASLVSVTALYDTVHTLTTFPYISLTTQEEIGPVSRIMTARHTPVDGPIFDLLPKRGANNWAYRVVASVRPEFQK